MARHHYVHKRPDPRSTPAFGPEQYRYCTQWVNLRARPRATCGPGGHYTRHICNIRFLFQQACVTVQAYPVAKSLIPGQMGLSLWAVFYRSSRYLKACSMARSVLKPGSVHIFGGGGTAAAAFKAQQSHCLGTFLNPLRRGLGQYIVSLKEPNQPDYGEVRWTDNARIASFERLFRAIRVTAAWNHRDC